MIDRDFDISTFKRAQEAMVAKNERAWDDFYSERYLHRLKDYTSEEIETIINSSSLASQQKLSYNYFYKNGFYRQILTYYATLLTYSGLLILNPNFGKQLSKSNIKKRYHNALEFLEKINLQELMTRMSLRVLIYGSYYGLIQTLDKDNLVIFDLPVEFCRSRWKDIYGNDIVEFDVSYFDKIYDEDSRREALEAYPKFISSFYKKKNRKTNWLRLPAELGICFSFYDEGRPIFLNVIPATIQYDEAVDTEQERALEEIRKIIVQKIPHLNDGQLLFEPEEAVEMHSGAVNMMKGNKNLSVLTTYADVDAIISKTAADNASSTLSKMLQNVFSNAGVSGQLFAPEGTQAIPISIKVDISLMMVLGNKYSRFISYIVNSIFGNNNMIFKYTILPISEHTRSEFADQAYKFAQGGYSFLLPAIALGINQLELVSIKYLENDILELKDKLLPLSVSYTESKGKPGAPEKKLEDKAKKTIQNEDAIDHQGGSDE